MTPFMQDFIKVIDGVPGATERDQIKYCVTNARPLLIGDAVVTDLSKVVTQFPHTIEHNLDFLSVPFKHLWIEWNEAARVEDTQYLRENRVYPEKIGVLVISYDEERGVFIAIVAWQFENGNIDYSHAILSWSTDVLSSHSEHARHRYSKVPSEVWLRLMSVTSSSIPEGFYDEIAILIESDDLNVSESQIHAEAQENSSAELLFLFSVLLFLQTRQSEITTICETDEEQEYYLLSQKQASVPKRFWRTPKGFSREKVNGEINLSFHRF